MWESVSVKDVIEVCLKVNRAFQVRVHVRVFAHE